MACAAAYCKLLQGLTLDASQHAGSLGDISSDAAYHHGLCARRARFASETDSLALD